MQLDELFHQCETDTQSFAHDAQAIVRLFEHVEYLGLLSGRYADTVVGYFDDREAIGFRNLDSDVTTFGRIARRITDYVADDLNETRGVPELHRYKTDKSRLSPTSLQLIRKKTVEKTIHMRKAEMMRLKR